MNDLLTIEVSGLEALDELYTQAEQMVIDAARGLTITLLNSLIPRTPQWSSDMTTQWSVGTLGSAAPAYVLSSYKIEPWQRLKQPPNEPYHATNRPNWRALQAVQRRLDADLQKLPRRIWLKGVTIHSAHPSASDVLTSPNRRDIRTSYAAPAAIMLAEFKYSEITDPLLLSLRNARLNVAPAPTTASPFVRNLAKTKKLNQRKARQKSALQRRERLAARKQRIFRFKPKKKFESGPRRGVRRLVRRGPKSRKGA